MRIVTRADFDGIVCAAILYDVLDIKKSVKWIEPSDRRKRDYPVGRAKTKNSHISGTLFSR